MTTDDERKAAGCTMHEIVGTTTEEIEKNVPHQSEGPSMREAEHKCCVADLVEHPCPEPRNCACSAVIVQVVRDLVKEGLIVDSGQRRRGLIVWIATERGRAASCA